MVGRVNASRQVTTCQVIWRGARVRGDNLSSWLVCQVELVTASRTCHLRKKRRQIFVYESLARRRRCLRDFPLRVLVCLKSVFSDGQDVKYDRDITPHPHLFHGTNSHEHSAHRDNRVHKTKQCRGMSTQFKVTGMSGLTYCVQIVAEIVAENTPTPQQHCQVEV